MFNDEERYLLCLRVEYTMFKKKEIPTMFNDYLITYLPEF